MNLGELKDWLRRQSHRVDLEDSLADFINRGQERIRREVDGAPATELGVDTDSNAVSSINPTLILYSAMIELKTFIEDMDEATLWEQRFEKELKKMNVTYYGEEWPQRGSYVRSESETYYESLDDGT